MVDEPNHSACVDDWMARAAKGVPAERLSHVFEHGFAALWRRAHQTLGDVTLTAVVDRVLHGAAEQFPFLSTLEIEVTGLRCQELHERAPSLPRDQLADAVRFVLVEFLTILGSLTAEILTPALHVELSKAALEVRGPTTTGSSDERAKPEGGGQEAGS